MIRSLCASALVLLALHSQALAQGADCSTATPISGIGTWSSIGVGGDSGWPDTACQMTQNHQDRFYQWTPAADGTYRLLSESNQPYIVMEIYAGVGCAATLEGCFFHGHTDVQRSWDLGFLTTTDTFLIRPVGGFEGTFTLQYLGGPCGSLPTDPLEPNSLCTDEAAIGNGQYIGLSLDTGGVDNFDIHAVCVAPGDTLTASVTADFPSSQAEFVLLLRERDLNLGGCGLPIGGTTYQARGFEPTLTYTNSTSQPEYFRLWVTAFPFEGCLEYDLEVTGANACGGVPVVTTFCDPMDPNSSGLPLQLDAVWGTGVHSGIRLEADQGPVGQFASLIVGNAFTEPGVMLGQGRFCLGQAAGQQFGRYNVAGTDMNSIGQFDADGRFANLVGTSYTQYGFDVPTMLPNFGSSIQVGSTWHFQMWSRDVGGQSNWSNGVSVQFTSLP